MQNGYGKCRQNGEYRQNRRSQLSELISEVFFFEFDLISWTFSNQTFLNKKVFSYKKGNKKNVEQIILLPEFALALN